MLSEDGRILSIEEADREYEKIKLDESVPSIEDSILMLLSIIPDSPIVSRTLMMKEVFLFYADFLKRFGIESDPIRDAGFFAYKYGPYSLRVNISLASLALAGKIKIRDFDDYLEEERKKMKGYEKLDLPDGNGRYHACFSTNVDFENIIARYKQEFEEHEINMYQFKNELMNFKWAWDQKTAAGVVLYIYNNPKFKEFIGKSELKDKFPEAYGGRVKEDYSPRLKAHAGTGRK
jgi:hypothetical protein